MTPRQPLFMLRRKRRRFVFEAMSLRVADVRGSEMDCEDSTAVRPLNFRRKCVKIYEGNTYYLTVMILCTVVIEKESP